MYIVSSDGGLMVRANKLYIYDASTGAAKFEIHHRGVGAKSFEYDVLAAYKTAAEALAEMNRVAQAMNAGEGAYRLACSTADM